MSYNLSYDIFADMLRHIEGILVGRGRPGLAKVIEGVRLELGEDIQFSTLYKEVPGSINKLIPQYSHMVEALVRHFADMPIVNLRLSVRAQISIERHFRPTAQEQRENPVKIGEVLALQRTELPGIWNFGKHSAAELGEVLELLLELSQIEGYTKGSLPQFLQEPWLRKSRTSPEPES